MHLKQQEQQYDLVASIEEKLGHTLSERIRNAFLSVSRHHFVPSYLKQEQPGEWCAFETTAVIYQDQALVTKTNQKNMPCSSSSQPSIMAAMLEALDVQPGMRVLEIGTGTGYNAALLSELVGEAGQVTSTDIDLELVLVARQRLFEAEYRNVTIQQGNALKDVPDGMYDRIILTGGFPQILSMWISRLDPHSRSKMVGNWLRTLASPLFCLEKWGDHVSGSLLSTPAFFMSLYTEEDIDTIAPGGRVNIKPLLAMPTIERDSTSSFMQAIYDVSFQLFLECHFPGIRMKPHFLGMTDGKPCFATCLIHDQNLAIFTPQEFPQYMVETHGDGLFWAQLQSVSIQWEREGRPSPADYVFTFSAGGAVNMQLALEREKTREMDKGAKQD